MGQVRYVDRREALVEELKALLTRAIEGDITGFAYVTADSDGSVSHNWVLTATHNGHTLTAGIADLKFHMLKERLSEAQGGDGD